jgi:glucose/arabinose dehydrogenase
MFSFRLGRLCLVVALAFAIPAGVDFAEVQGQTTQQQQQNKNNNNNKNKNKNKNKNLPAVTPTTLPPNTLANGMPIPMPMPGQPPTKTVEKELEWPVSEDVTVQRLKSFPTGLNFVDAKPSDVADGQKMTITVTAKGDKDSKKVDHYSGILVRYSDNKMTLRCTFTDKEETPTTDGKEVVQMSIRTVEKNN